LTRTYCALRLQKNESERLQSFFYAPPPNANGLSRRQYSGVSNTHASAYSCVSARPRRRTGVAGGACAEQGAHEKGAWPPPLSPRKIKRRP
jgi:hypothetical protein